VISSKTENRNPSFSPDQGPLFENSGCSVFIRQLALNEPVTGGNKVFKLKYNLIKARGEGKKKLLTFGGTYSNHIAATALAGKREGFETYGVIRGEAASARNNTLTRAVADGMHLIFVSREDYRKKNDPEFLKTILTNYDEFYIIPEGGANAEGVKGCLEILNEDDSKYDHIVVSCGTGTTAAGIIMSMKPYQQLTGISILRDGGSIESEIKKWIDEFKPSQRLPLWEINHDYDFGGYAKKNNELENYCTKFEKQTGIKIEPIYTGKMFWGIEKLIEKGYFKPSSKILAIHTGGLQYFGE